MQTFGRKNHTFFYFFRPLPLFFGIQTHISGNASLRQPAFVVLNKLTLVQSETPKKHHTYKYIRTRTRENKPAFPLRLFMILRKAFRKFCKHCRIF